MYQALKTALKDAGYAVSEGEELLVNELQWARDLCNKYGVPIGEEFHRFGEYLHLLPGNQLSEEAADKVAADQKAAQDAADAKAKQDAAEAEAAQKAAADAKAAQEAADQKAAADKAEADAKAAQDAADAAAKAAQTGGDAEQPKE